MREREEVFKEFYRADAWKSRVDMADEIVRLREALAAATRVTITEEMVERAAEVIYTATNRFPLFADAHSYIREMHAQTARAALTAALAGGDA